MLRRTPLKQGSGFKRRVYEAPPPAPPRPATRRAEYGGATTGPVPKEPADRLQALRDLARGEDCLLQLPGCCCHPETTVWGHTNTLSDRKGLGYKASDSKGFFVGHDCHAELDQGSRFSEEQKARFVQLAQERTRTRLQEIAACLTLKPWRVAAARAALALLQGEAA
jgi:hypothetical protein